MVKAEFLTPLRVVGMMFSFAGWVKWMVRAYAVCAMLSPARFEAVAIDSDLLRRAGDTILVHDFFLQYQKASPKGQVIVLLAPVIVVDLQRVPIIVVRTPNV